MHSGISCLDHRDQIIAQCMHAVFQRSYRIEAGLVGVEDFPPLRRSVADLQAAATRFYGYLDNRELAAVIEFTPSMETLHINSLVVDPAFFRLGYGSALLQTVLASQAWVCAEVETAVVNAPAIALYQQFGFEQVRQWRAEMDIPKVLLRKLAEPPVDSI